jgi:hypothetical protein
MNKKEVGSLRFPVLEHGAESLVQGYLMRRNILTYQAPRKNEGYDLICMTPEPRRKAKTLRVQVKSRYQTDCDRSIIVPRKSRGGFDFVVAVFLNVGYFYRKGKGLGVGKREPEFFTLPAAWVERHRNESSSWGKLSLKRRGIDRFKNDEGFELIARRLGVAYPVRPPRATPGHQQLRETAPNARRQLLTATEN